MFRMMTKTGTVAFSAPEIFTQKIYDEKVDIWSAGTVLYMMLCGDQPFNHDQMAKLVQKITSEEPSFDDEAFYFVSDDVMSLIKLMLSKEPDLRPSAEECLNHDWFEDSPFKPSNSLIGDIKGKQSSVLDRAKSSLVSRQSLKKAGKLNFSQVMPVQTLMQDLLRNGIDLRTISESANFRHSVSVIFDNKPNLDK